MQIKFKKQVGDTQLEVDIEGQSFKEAMLKGAFLFEKDFCWLDGFQDAPIKWEARKAKSDNGEFIYVKRVARTQDGRIATSTLGEYQGGGYFWKGWEEYKKDDSASPEDPDATPF